MTTSYRTTNISAKHLYLRQTIRARRYLEKHCPQTLDKKKVILQQRKTSWISSKIFQQNNNFFMKCPQMWVNTYF